MFANLLHSWKPAHRRLCPRNSHGKSIRRTFRPTLEALEEIALLSFLPAMSYPVGQGPQNTAIGSFRGDGTLDLAITNIDSGTVSVLLGNGDGTFQSAVNYPTGGSGSKGLAAGEFRTGSGIQDLVVTNSSSNTLALLQGNGDGTFQSPVQIAGGFQTPSLIDQAVDLDQDGNLDLLVVNQSGNTVSVLLSNGDGSFQAPVNYTVDSSNFHNPREVNAADLRGMGVLDLVVTPASGNDIAVLLGNGGGTFQNPAYYTVGDPSNVTIGEFRTGSGILDVAVTNRFNNTVSVLLGNGDGTFQTPTSYAIGSSSLYPDVTVGDFDQDGNLDLVATNFGGNSVSVLLGNGDGTFRAPTSYTVGSQPDGVRAGDFDGDGYPDLAVINFGSNNVAILLNDGNWPLGLGRPARRQASGHSPKQPTPTGTLPTALGEFARAAAAWSFSPRTSAGSASESTGPVKTLLPDQALLTLVSQAEAARHHASTAHIVLVRDPSDEYLRRLDSFLTDPDGATPPLGVLADFGWEV